MGTIIELLNAVKSLDLPNQVPQIIQKTSYNIIGLNQAQLYDKSIDSNGEPLRFYGSLSYALEKEKMNPKPGFGRPDLYVTGAFYSGFYVKTEKNAFIIYSTDSKTAELVKNFGKDMFGLTPENTSEYAQNTFKSELQKYITSVTGLRFGL